MTFILYVILHQMCRPALAMPWIDVYILVVNQQDIPFLTNPRSKYFLYLYGYILCKHRLMAFSLQIPGSSLDVYMLKLPPRRKLLPVPGTVQFKCGSWANEPTSHTKQGHQTTDAAVQHLSFLHPLLLHHDCTKRESRWNREQDVSHFPLTYSNAPPPNSLIRKKWERVDSQHRLSSTSPHTSRVHGSQRREGDRRHMDKSTTHIQGTSTHVCMRCTHTYTLAHRSLIFPWNHPLSATAAFTANCPSAGVRACVRVCVCVSVIQPVVLSQNSMWLRSPYREDGSTSEIFHATWPLCACCDV